MAKAECGQVKFIDENGGGPGVRLTRAVAARSEEAAAASKPSAAAKAVRGQTGNAPKKKR
jgi:hypothetical protein